MAKDLPGSAALRKSPELLGHYIQWPWNENISAGYDPADVHKHCVENAEWQKIRLSMKGKPTHEKLAILINWWTQQRDTARIENNQDLWWATEVQVGNYLEALRRGGQLNDNNQIRKYI